MRFSLPERNQFCFFLIAFVAATLAPIDAYGIGGQLALKVTSGHEVARLQHPTEGFETPLNRWSYQPRLGLQADYSLSHTWSVGAGAEYSFVRGATFEDVILSQGGGGDLVGNTESLFFPFGLNFHLSRGGDWSATATAAAGPMLTQWDDIAVYRQSSGLSHSYEHILITNDSRWQSSLAMRASLTAEWRPTSLFAVSSGPYVTAGMHGSFALGLAIQAQMQWGVGPYF